MAPCRCRVLGGAVPLSPASQSLSGNGPVSLQGARWRCSLVSCLTVSVGEWPRVVAGCWVALFPCLLPHGLCRGMAPCRCRVLGGAIPLSPTSRSLSVNGPVSLQGVGWRCSLVSCLTVSVGEWPRVVAGCWVALFPCLLPHGLCR